jgi:hypothetical protein
MKKGSYHYHLIVFENAVHVDSISGPKSSMRRIGQCRNKKAGDPKKEMSYECLHCRIIVRLSIAGWTSRMNF